jgi:hypothetical protein
MSDDYSIEEKLTRSLGWALQFVKPRTPAERAMLDEVRAHVVPGHHFDLDHRALGLGLPRLDELQGGAVSDALARRDRAAEAAAASTVGAGGVVAERHGTRGRSGDRGQFFGRSSAGRPCAAEPGGRRGAA